MTYQFEAECLLVASFCARHFVHLGSFCKVPLLSSQRIVCRVSRTVTGNLIIRVIGGRDPLTDPKTGGGTPPISPKYNRLKGAEVGHVITRGTDSRPPLLAFLPPKHRSLLHSFWHKIPSCVVVFACWYLRYHHGFHCQSYKTSRPQCCLRYSSLFTAADPSPDNTVVMACWSFK